MARILIIDDDAGVRGVLQAMLERAGHAVVVAMGGAEGLRLARQQKPDLALVDIEMPGMNGFDVCSLFKTDTALSMVPVVIMTGRPVAGVPAQAQTVGAADFLGKPFERETLLKVVNRHLGAEGTA